MVFPRILERKPCPTEEATRGHPLGVGAGEVRILGPVRGRETGGGKKREETGCRLVVAMRVGGRVSGATGRSRPDVSVGTPL